MKVYVASRSNIHYLALEEGNVLAACATGPNPLGDAKSYAYDHTRATDEPTWVYEVDVAVRGGYKVQKEVVFAPK